MTSLLDGLLAGGHKLALMWSGEPITTAYMSRAVSGYGWVYFVESVYYVVDRNQLFVQFLNGLIGGLTVLVIYAIAARLFKRAAARRAALFMTFFPQVVFWPRPGERREEQVDETSGQGAQGSRASRDVVLTAETRLFPHRLVAARLHPLAQPQDRVHGQGDAQEDRRVLVHAGGLRQALVVPETLVWYALIPAFIRGLAFAVKRQLRAILPILVFAVSLTAAYAIMKGNVGTAYCQRTQITMSFFIFMGVGLAERRRQREASAAVATPTAWQPEA